MRNKLPLYKQGGFHLFLFNLPFLILVFILVYLPVRGWIYAFFDYKPGIPLNKTEYVGFFWFSKLVADSFTIKNILRVLSNTFGIKFLGILLSPFTMFFAMFLADVNNRQFRKLTQSLVTLPHFISWVLVYAVAFAIFSTNDGLLNKVLLAVGLIDNPVNYLISTKALWLKMVLWGMWKETGWGTIIYFAAMSGIDQELYQAATVDGAGRFRLMFSITLPHLLPTYFVLLILSISRFLNTGVEQYLFFSNPMTQMKLEVLDLYIYNQGIWLYQYSYTTAVGILKTFVGIALLFSANKLSKIVRGDAIM